MHAGIIEPGHFRFTCDGETVVRLEQRLGYAHKGVEALLAGAALPAAARIAGRVCGDSTVAYALAFARAAEAALGAEPPPRAVWLRALMAELERLANHLGDVGAICNDAAFTLMLAHCAVLRERVLRAASACFGHRLMMDAVVPGGVAVDLPADGAARLARAGATSCVPASPRWSRCTTAPRRLQDRTVGTGIVTAALAARFGAGGHVGRASGRGFDARRSPGYPPYDRLAFDDADAHRGRRERPRLDPHRGDRTKPAPGRTDPRSPARRPRARRPAGSGRRGDGAGGRLPRRRAGLGADGRRQGRARCHLRDPSWFQWPLLEAAIEGNIVADFPLCNKSFNCSYSGHDL